MIPIKMLANFKNVSIIIITAQLAVVFGINSASNAGEIARGASQNTTASCAVTG